MVDAINKILKEKNIFSHLNAGITVATVGSLHDGYALAQAILYHLIDAKTVLYLSGGSTPKVLYERFAKEERLLPGAVGVVDERFGTKFHEKSNEKLLQETGLLRYFQMRSIPFYPILQGKNREETAASYDEKFRTLNATYQKSVGILGIGTDGHIASIAPKRPDFMSPMFAANHALVAECNDPNSLYGERVGMTFVGLSMLDVLVVLVFGDAKQKPLDLLFADGPEEELPARFFKRPDVAKKTLFITDQRI